MTLDQFIAEIKKRKDLRNIVHHEVIPPVKPSYGQTKPPLMPPIKEALSALGINDLYGHQTEGIDLIRQGKNCVIMTPTASGKSLIYNVPVLESLMSDPDSKALYIFPLKGLEQDQLKALKELTEALPLLPAKVKKGAAFTPSLCEIYDGDTTAYRKKKIRESPPPVVLTNPDMLHLAINPFHQKWERFFKGLKYVVIDEVHAYRGVFGSHVANVLKRFRRVAALYGSDPQFIACSATIENPQELCQMLTGKKFDLVWKSGAPAGKKNFIFMNPPWGSSPYTMATKLFIAAVSAGFKTIAFTKARKVTELMHSWVREAAPELDAKISSYRAGFLPSERRVIEAKLFGGELSGVITTSALELGVDIGGLDVCILVGYPGTISSTWQRAGRAGRGSRDSLIAMCGMADALDQHFMRNPAGFFSKGPEAAVLDADNPTILKKHLLCAASESPLRPADKFYDAGKNRPILEELEREEKLRFWVKGNVWYPRKKYPQMEVSIRAAGEAYSIVKEDGSAIGESSGGRVLRELHPGAIYLHRGVQYRVIKLDMAERAAVCRPALDANFYTRAIANEESEIVSIADERRLKGVTMNLGTLKITERVTGYRKKNMRSDEALGEFPLALPASVFTTTGIWMKVDEGALSEIKALGYSPAGSLHAVEHAQIASLPLFALCDRMDLGGVSYAFNQELGSPAIFIYDGHEGGVGLTKRGFECAPEWFEAALRLMSECPCEIACPSCTQDPKCGNNNEPLDKRGAIMILRGWMGE